MTLEPGEAAVLIIRRSDQEPTKYFVAVRKAGSSFDEINKDFQLFAFQESLMETGQRLELPEAMEQAIAAIKELKA